MPNKYEQIGIDDQAQVEVERYRSVNDQVSIQDPSWVVVHGTPAEPTPWNDKVYNCEGYDANGNRDKGVIFISVDCDGTIPFRTILDAVIDISIEVEAMSRPGTLISGDDNSIDISVDVLGDIYLIPPKNNFVCWSDIGKADFVIRRGNVAGEMPMEWRGWIYRVMKLGSSIVVYGQNGVALMMPVNAPAVTFGRQLISSVGLIAKNAVTGDDRAHWYINKAGVLYKLTPPANIEMLDYREFLASMNSNTIMSYDPEDELVYICDGVRGYVLSKWGLGEGPVNITGVGRRTGTLYITAPAYIETDPFEICTDIIDFGDRDIKSIYEVDLGADTTIPTWVAVDHRYDIDKEFETTPWFRANDQGQAFFTVSGVEFRFRVKLLWRDYFELDYIRVLGKSVDKGARPK